MDRLSRSAVKDKHHRKTLERSSEPLGPRANRPPKIVRLKVPQAEETSKKKVPATNAKSNPRDRDVRQKAKAKAPSYYEVRQKTKTKAPSHDEVRQKAKAKVPSQDEVRQKAKAKAPSYNEVRQKTKAKVPSHDEVRQRTKAKVPSHDEVRQRTKAKVPSHDEVRQKAKAKVPSQDEVRQKAKVKAPSYNEVRQKTKAKVPSHDEVRQKAKAKVPSHDEVRQKAKAKAPSKELVKPQTRVSKPSAQSVTIHPSTEDLAITGQKSLIARKKLNRIGTIKSEADVTARRPTQTPALHATQSQKSIKDNVSAASSRYSSSKSGMAGYTPISSHPSSAASSRMSRSSKNSAGDTEPAKRMNTLIVLDENDDTIVKGYDAFFAEEKVKSTVGNHTLTKRIRPKGAKKRTDWIEPQLSASPVSSTASGISSVAGSLWSPEPETVSSGSSRQSSMAGYTPISSRPSTVSTLTPNSRPSSNYSSRTLRAASSGKSVRKSETANSPKTLEWISEPVRKDGARLRFQ